jgi:hypothetical protein
LRSSGDAWAFLLSRTFFVVLQNYRNQSVHRKIALYDGFSRRESVAEMSQINGKAVREWSAGPPNAGMWTTGNPFRRQETVASVSDNDPASCPKQPHSAAT